MLANTFSVSLVNSALHRKYFRSSFFLNPLLEYLFSFLADNSTFFQKIKPRREKSLNFMSSACRLNVFPPPPHFLSVEEMSFILFGTTCPSLFGDYNPHIISLSIFSASFSTYLFHSCIKTCSSPIVKYVPYIPSPTLVLSLEDLISCHQLLTSPLPSLSSFFSFSSF